MVAVLFGTRPEFIKIGPLLKELEQKRIKYILIHSGQHYSTELNKLIIEDLSIPKPDYNLNVGSSSQAEQTGKIMIGVEKILKEVKPRVLVVHGDTNTMLAGSIAAKKLHIPVAHVEAGLRSFDERMPEEINRIITDRISDLLFTPTEITKQNLLNEGIDKNKIFVTGNTIVDALSAYLPLTNKSSILKDLGLKQDKFMLATIHRSENVDDKINLEKVVSLLGSASNLLNLKVIWPIHPHTKNRLEEYKIQLKETIQVIQPVGYLDILTLINSAQLILTDSGGIQEEAYLLKKWIVTLRNSTERPETLTANFLVDQDYNKLKKAILAFQEGKIFWEENVFGKGDAAKQIASHLENYLKNEKI